MVRFHLTEPVKNMASISDMNDMEIGTASNVSFGRLNAELLSNCSATPKQKRVTSG